MAPQDKSLLESIIEAPTVLNKTHQSVYRQWLVLGYVRWLVENKTPHEVILKIMDDLDNLPNKSGDGE